MNKLFFYPKGRFLKNVKKWIAVHFTNPPPSLKSEPLEIFFSSEEITIAFFYLEKLHTSHMAQIDQKVTQISS